MLKQDKEIVRFAQMLKKSLNIDLKYCIEIVKMLKEKASSRNILSYIFANCNCYVQKNIDQCLVNVDSEYNVMIGTYVFYESQSSHKQPKKLGELKYVNDVIYFTHIEN